MSEANERLLEFQSTGSPELAMQTHRMLKKRHFPLGRIMKLPYGGCTFACASAELAIFRICGGSISC